MGQFTLAVNRRFTNKNGEREADFIHCVIWGNGAENLAQYTRKGYLIGITGRIQTRHYDNTQGQTVYVTEVIVESFDFLESSKKLDNSNNAGNKQDQTYMNQTQQSNFNEDDLPF